MTEELIPNEIYIQLGENRIGTEICLRRWQETPFEGGIKYTRAQPKYKRVDLETLYKNTCNCEGDGGPCMSCAHDFGWNEAIDDIKSKYGELYAEVK